MGAKVVPSPSGVQQSRGDECMEGYCRAQLVAQTEEDRIGCVDGNEIGHGGVTLAEVVL